MNEPAATIPYLNSTYRGFQIWKHGENNYCLSEEWQYLTFNSAWSAKVWIDELKSP